MIGDREAWLRALPAMRWWHRVNRETLRADLIAGLVGAVVVLPQGIAFATLAGLPPAYGLYAAMVPAVVAALWGSSWHLVSGPTNAISLVVLASVSQLATPGTERYISLVLMLTFLVGMTQLVAGVARLGVLANFISHTVVVGFTAGAALLIAASQLQNFFGLPMSAGLSFPETLLTFALHAAKVDTATALVGVVTLATGIAARRWLPRAPYMIVAMIAGALAGQAIDRLGATGGIRMLGALPAALPPLSLPQFSFDTMRALGNAAVAVSLLGLVEAVSIARSIAVKSGQRIEGNQEFIGQGLSNLAGSFFSAYPSSGSFNRSAANFEAGARTPLASVFAAAFLVVIVLSVGPIAAYVPVASMAAILLLVAWGLLDLRQMRTIVRASRAEGVLLAVTVLATLTLHLEMAILFGIALSLLLYLNRTSRPALRSIVPDAGSPLRKFRERQPGEAECPQLRILRIEGSLYFGAVHHVGEYLQKIEERRSEQRHLLLLSKSMNFVDVAGAELLAAEAQRRRARGGTLHFCGLRDSAAAILFGPVFAVEFGSGSRHATKQEAVAAIVARLDREVCARCTARIFRECADLPAPASSHTYGVIVTIPGRSP